MPIPVQVAVDRLMEARSTHRLATPLSETDPDLTLEQAYAIQGALRTALVAKGEKVIGWKLGFTAPAGQAAMGLKEPASGFLLSGQHASGAEVSMSRFAGLCVEVEVALRLRTKLVGPGVTADSAALAVEGALPAFELPDFLFAGKPRGVDIVADDVHANAIVLGSPLTPLRGFDLAVEGVVYEHNGDIVGTHTAAEVMGNPLNALAWLANHLERRGLELKPGDIVITGSISKLLRPKAGDTIRARFTRLGSVAIKVVP
jgi:2-keto-4-pentenoate hydratase